MNFENVMLNTEAFKLSLSISTKRGSILSHQGLTTLGEDIDPKQPAFNSVVVFLVGYYVLRTRFV